MPDHVTACFGAYAVRFVCDDPGVLDLLDRHFRESLTDAEPDVTLAMMVVEPGAIAPVDALLASQYVFFEHAQVNFGPNLLEGRWDFDRNLFCLRVARELLVPEELWLFDRFLCRLYYTLVMRDTRRKASPLIVHCAGVIRDGRAYIFFGPPGSGKSTVAGLSQAFTVLHDDMNIVTLGEAAVTVTGAPFNPKLIERSNGSAPLAMICSLHKSDRIRLEPGTPDEFMQKIVSEIFLPQPLFTRERNRAFQYMLQCLGGLSRRVPYYRLHFKKDASFWEAIAYREEHHGYHAEHVCSPH